MHIKVEFFLENATKDCYQLNALSAANINSKMKALDSKAFSDYRVKNCGIARLSQLFSGPSRGSGRGG